MEQTGQAGIVVIIGVLSSNLEEIIDPTQPLDSNSDLLLNLFDFGLLGVGIGGVVDMPKSGKGVLSREQRVSDVASVFSVHKSSPRMVEVELGDTDSTGVVSADIFAIGNISGADGVDRSSARVALMVELEAVCL